MYGGGRGGAHACMCGSNSVFKCGSNSVFKCGSNSVFKCGSNSVFMCGSNSVFKCGSNSEFNMQIMQQRRFHETLIHIHETIFYKVIHK